MMRPIPFIAIYLAFALASIAAPLHACNVPVFRYALEKWAPDAYVVTVFHKGPLPEAARKDVELLRSLVKGVEHQLENYFVDVVDVDQPMSDLHKRVLEATKPASFPWMHVQYPNSLPKDPPAYSGEMSEAVIRQLADSPTRRDIARLLLQGESVVWLLVECGDKAKDDAAAVMLQGELTKLMKKLKLPELSEDDLRFYDPKAGPPLKLSFKMLRMSRQAVGEAMFLQVLENWNPKDGDATQPTAFAFFGRGRVLPPMFGKHLEPGLIGEACEYLIGACSCQVKEENPGYDVLMSVEWDSVIRQTLTLAEALPKLTTAAAVVQQNQVILGTTPVAAGSGIPQAGGGAGEVELWQNSSREGSAVFRNVILTGLVLVVVIAAATFTMRRRQDA